MSFLPASVVPLDMDELRDSVVSGRFIAVSSLVRGEAAGGPDGLGARGRDRGSGKEAGSRTDKEIQNEWDFTANCVGVSKDKSA